MRLIRVPCAACTSWWQMHAAEDFSPDPLREFSLLPEGGRAA
jgi:hypothetical protein